MGPGPNWRNRNVSGTKRYKMVQMVNTFYRNAGNGETEKRETLLVKAREISTCDSTRMADGWIEVVDTDGRTCYVQLNTGQIRYDKPPQWVESMMKLFNK